MSSQAVKIKCGNRSVYIELVSNMTNISEGNVVAHNKDFREETTKDRKADHC